MTAAGYSGTPLAKKLGLKTGLTVLPLEAPVEYARLLGEVPAGVEWATRLDSNVDIIHVFAVRKSKLFHHLQSLRRSMREDAAIWVSWPKKASRVPTDITEDVIRECALRLGLVDVKVCAVSDVWSGLRLVIRKQLRRKS